MKKGFTLIELLGVILILSLIMLIAIPRLINFKNDINTDELTEKMIYDAAKLYVSDHSEKYIEKEDNVYCVTVRNLVNNNYVKGPIKLNSDLDETNELSVKITYEHNSFSYLLDHSDNCSIVPDGYKLVDYIESTGTQYIDTDKSPAAIDPIAELEFMPTASTQNTAIYGVAKGTGDKRFLIQSNKIGIGKEKSTSFSKGIYYIVKLDGKNCKSVVNGVEETASYNNTRGFNDLKLYLFQINSGNISGLPMRLYRYKLRNNETLVQNMIPCRKSNGEVGMYDTVEGTFYKSESEDAFIAGPEV